MQQPLQHPTGADCNHCLPAVARSPSMRPRQRTEAQLRRNLELREPTSRGPLRGFQRIRGRYRETPHPSRLRTIPLVTTALNQIEEYLTAVAIGILASQRTVDGEIGRPARSAQSILSISFIGAAVLDQKTLTKMVYEIVIVAGIRGVAHAFSKCDSGFPQTLADQCLRSEPVPGPELWPSCREQLLKLILAARFKQA